MEIRVWIKRSRVIEQFSSTFKQDIPEDVKQELENK